MTSSTQETPEEGRMKLEFCYKNYFVKLLSYPEGRCMAGAMPSLAIQVRRQMPSTR